MTKKISKERKNMMFEVRKNLIDKICTWEQRVFYSFMIFIGAIIISLISNIDKLPLKNEIHALIIIGIIIFLGLFILIFVEYYSWKRIFRFHGKLLDDINNDELEDIEKFSIRKYLFQRF